MTGDIWQKDSWWRLLGLLLGLMVCVHAFRQVAVLPWGEILAFSLLAVALRQRPVPLARDSEGKVILAHVPGESLLIVLILRHGGGEAAICASFLTNLLASVLRRKEFFTKPSQLIGATSNIFWLPFLAFVWTQLYYRFGGIALQTPEDCSQMFRDPRSLALPFLGASLIAIDLVNRFYQGYIAHLRYDSPLRQACGDPSVGIFEHLENAGALLSLALWTTWKWGTLPFILLLMEAFLLAAREKVQHVEARKQAASDPLTGLSSARGLSEALERRVRPAAPGFAVLYLDMDHFKAVNDTYGHSVGDELLVLVGQTLQAHVRAGDLVARCGGDEFVVLLSGRDRAGAEEARERLRQAVEEATACDSRFQQVSFSAGIGLFPGDGQTKEALLDAADQAMYAEKQARRRALAA